MDETENREPCIQDGVQKMPGITRRGLVAGLGGVAVLAAVGGAGVALAGTDELLRPPGGQDDDLFMAACIRCDRCRSVCPSNGVDVATVEDGLVNVRTPKMSFHIGYCNGCDGEFRCIEACPTGALAAFDKTTQKMGLAHIIFDRCEAFGASARCKYDCIAWCPEDALSKDDEGRLLLDEGLCWGCGMCEYACPSNSYRAYDGSTQRGIEVRPWKGDGDA